MFCRCRAMVSRILFFVALSVMASQAQTQPPAGQDQCNVPQRGDSTSGLLKKVVDYKSTIGYAGLDSVLKTKSEEQEFDTCILHVAAMKNKNGRVVLPSTDGAQAAVRSRASAFSDSACPGFGLCAEVHDGPDADVWPLSTLTYLVIPTNTTDEEDGCDKMKTVYDYVKWILTDSVAADIAKDQVFATMPQTIADQALTILDDMKCKDADGVVRLIKDRATSSDAIEGGGSSLQGNLQTKLTNAFFQQTFTSIAYTASSSGTGRGALRDFRASFAGSDSILDMSEPEFIRRQVKMIPAFVTAVALVYNLDGADELVLTREAVAGIFSGTITAWDNPALRSENPDAFLSNEAVVRVVRSSASGTTSALTKAIYSFAGLPDGNGANYDLHPLEGSSLPDWPIPALPYADGATCNFRSCIKQICEPGERLDVGLEACVPCAAGFFSSTRGQDAHCDPCPKGSYTNTVGNSKCAKCDEFHYQDAVGQQHCQPCPANTRRFFADREVDGRIQNLETPGEDSNECKCVQGTWLPASVNHTDLGGEACVSCPVGATCAGYTDGEQQIPVSKANYWGDPENPERFLECQPGSCKANYECEAGHSGRVCAQPENGFFSIGRQWYAECPATKAGRVLLIMGGSAAVVLFWCSLRTWCFSNLDALGIVLGFLQAFYILARMRLRWHPAIQMAAAVLSLFNYDVAFFGWECISDSWDGTGLYFLQMALPFILTAISALEYAVRWWFEIRVASASRDKNVRSKGILRNPRYLPDKMSTFVLQRFLTFMAMMFHTLCMYALIPFVCDEEPDGKTQYLKWMPEVRCGTEGYQAMKIVSILYMLLVLIPGPIYLCNVLWSAYKKDLLNLYDFMEQYGTLYAKYHCHFPCWELLRVLRRVLLGVVLITVSVPMIQAVLAILIINLALYAHLIYQPMVHPHAANLEVAGLLTSMFMAVCGMLFFPSLDKSVECVGSADLVSTIGEQCGRNETLKLRLAVVLLVLIILLFLVALVLSMIELHARRLAEKTAKRMKEIMLEQQQRQVGTTLIQEDSNSTDGAQHEFIARQLATENSWNPVWDAPSCWQGLKYRLGIAKAPTEHTKNGIVDPYTLKLCHMIHGYHLHWWQCRMQSLDETRTGDGSPRARGWDRVKESVHLHKEELAYILTDESLAKFATIFDHVWGFYVNDGLAKKLRQVCAAFPLLIDWLAHAPPAMRQDLALVMLSLTAFAQKQQTNAFSKVVMTEYRAPVLHWLMRCTDEQRRSFRVVFSAIAASSGLSATKILDLGLGLSPTDDLLEVSPGCSPLTSLPRRVPSNGDSSPGAWTTASASGSPTRNASVRKGSEAASKVADAGWGTVREAPQVASLDPVPVGEQGSDSAMGRDKRSSVVMEDGTEISELQDY